jgi:hypothetical protein
MHRLPPPMNTLLFSSEECLALVNPWLKLWLAEAHIIICGRNKKAVDFVLASLPEPTKEFKTKPMREFVHCDATMMSNVHATTTDLLARLPKINFLILSIGVVTCKIDLRN